MNQNKNLFKNTIYKLYSNSKNIFRYINILKIYKATLNDSKKLLN